jgi:3,4-dihydroxy-2-butanone 4-phosphate synthase
MVSQTRETFQFDTIDDVVSDIAKGRMVIVTDDADRENEGDLVMAAEKVTPEAVNFMATHGRGLICVPISNERAEQLGLQRMVTQNREKHRTDFTVSVDAARGVTTGISAYDRATTILAIANPKSSPEDLSRGTCFHCEPTTAACCAAQGTPRPLSILPAWLGCNRRACSAKFCTTTEQWRVCRS